MRYKSPFEDVIKPKKVKEVKVKQPRKVRYRFELSIDYADEEIINELAKHPNKSEYVRQLIRDDIRGR